MSTYYGYYCETCDESSPHWINHGDTALRALYAHREVFCNAERLINETPIASLMQGIEYWSGVVDTPTPTEFLALHEGHTIGLEDEYRRRSPMEG